MEQLPKCLLLYLTEFICFSGFINLKQCNKYFYNRLHIKKIPENYKLNNLILKSLTQIKSLYIGSSTLRCVPESVTDLSETVI